MTCLQNQAINTLTQYSEAPTFCLTNDSGFLNALLYTVAAVNMTMMGVGVCIGHRVTYFCHHVVYYNIIIVPLLEYFNVIFKFYKQKLTTALSFACGVLLLMPPSWAGDVSVSNYPLYLLSQEVTQGKKDATVLLGVGDVGHHGSLSPASLKMIKDSQFVVWFGQALETNLVDTLSASPNAISLFQFNAFNRKALRDIDGKPVPDSFDPHIWLDPTNAKAMVAALTVIHSHANPQYKADYEANAQVFYQKMDKAAEAYRLTNPAPYWAYHDAYQYLESALNLDFKGALTPDHHLSPKASRFKLLSENRPRPTMCLASQTAISDGIKSRLAPLNTLVRQEDMSDGKNFISAWVDIATKFAECTQT